MREQYYPHLIHEFYGSLAKGDGWVAMVRGILILITNEMLARVWYIPLRGPIANCLSDKEADFRYILEREDVREIFVIIAN